MKKVVLLFSLVLTTVYCVAQTDSINPAIPHYKILKVDSTYATWNQLKKDVPVLIIYFGPDCPHCQHLMTEMEKNMEPFKNFQIVMITFTKTEYPYMNMIKDFSRNYSLPKYKNITMGTEYPTNSVLNYYKVTTTPFIAIYDRKGKMIQSINKPPRIEDLIAAVKKV